MNSDLKQIIDKPYAETTRADYRKFNAECIKRDINPILAYVKIKKEKHNIK